MTGPRKGGPPVRWGILATGGITGLFTRDLLAHGHTVQTVGSRTPQGAEHVLVDYQAAEIEDLVREGRTASERMPPEASVAVMRTMDRVRERIALRYPGE